MYYYKKVELKLVFGHRFVCLHTVLLPETARFGDRFGCRRSVRRNRSLCFTIFPFPGGSQVIHRLFQRFGGRAKLGDLRIWHGQDNQPASGVRMGFEHGFSAGDCFVIPLSNLKPDRSPLFRRSVRWPFGCGEQMAVELPPGKRPGLAEPNRCAEAVFGNRPSDKNTKSPIETEFVARVTSRVLAVPVLDRPDAGNLQRLGRVLKFLNAFCVQRIGRHGDVVARAVLRRVLPFGHAFEGEIVVHDIGLSSWKPFRISRFGIRMLQSYGFQE